MCAYVSDDGRTTWTERLNKETNLEFVMLAGQRIDRTARLARPHVRCAPVDVPWPRLTLERVSISAKGNTPTERRKRV